MPTSTQLTIYAQFYLIDTWRDMASLALNLTSGKYTKILPGKAAHDNFRMNTGYGRYSATNSMVALSCFNDKLSCVWVELLLLPKNPTEAKVQATSTWGESTEPTKGVMKHTYKVVLYNYCLMQYCCILSYQLVSREGCNPNQWEKVSKSMDSSSIGNR
jgi:hypothetical protein